MFALCRRLTALPRDPARLSFAAMASAGARGFQEKPPSLPVLAAEIRVIPVFHRLNPSPIPDMYPRVSGGGAKLVTFTDGQGSAPAVGIVQGEHVWRLQDSLSGGPRFRGYRDAGSLFMGGEGETALPFPMRRRGWAIGLLAWSLYGAVAN